MKKNYTMMYGIEKVTMQDGYIKVYNRKYDTTCVFEVLSNGAIRQITKDIVCNPKAIVKFYNKFGKQVA